MFEQSRVAAMEYACKTSYRHWFHGFVREGVDM
jgi:hypothetical protein